MATHRIPIPDDLWTELQARSEAEGKGLEELVEAALRRGLEDINWSGLWRTAPIVAGSQASLRIRREMSSTSGVRDSASRDLSHHRHQRIRRHDELP